MSDAPHRTRFEPAPRTRFVLIEPSHAGNVGGAARALMVMGFGELVLVRPRWPNVLRRKETIERASGATGVLAAARVVESLDEALGGMTHLCATAMTARDFGPPTRSPRAHFEWLARQRHDGCPNDVLLSNKELPAQPGQAMAADSAPEMRQRGETPDVLAASRSAPAWPEGIAFLFGCERYGMRNEDVYRCHVALSIPANPSYGSLNLAAAVQLIAYEWRQAIGFGQPAQDAPGAHGEVPSPSPVTPSVADAPEVAGMLAHWQQVLQDIGFLDPAAPKKLMPRLQQLANRAQLAPEEIHILRGIARAVQRRAAAGD